MNKYIDNLYYFFNEFVKIFEFSDWDLIVKEIKDDLVCAMVDYENNHIIIDAEKSYNELYSFSVVLHEILHLYFSKYLSMLLKNREFDILTDDFNFYESYSQILECSEITLSNKQFLEKLKYRNKNSEMFAYSVEMALALDFYDEIETWDKFFLKLLVDLGNFNIKKHNIDKKEIQDIIKNRIEFYEKT